MAANILCEISQDEKARIQYENELLAELDVRSRISDARKEGREIGIKIGKEIGKGIVIGKEEGINATLQVISALMAHTPIDEIAVKYNMSVEQIERIKETITMRN